MKSALFLTFGLLALPALSAPPIEVIALFKDRVMLEVGGERRLLQAGQPAADGLLLVSADSREAVIEVDGERLVFDLSNRIGSRFQPPEKAMVSIALNKQGQYRTSGSIGGRPASFLVDTGANILAMNSDHARRLGIDYADARRIDAVTAGGVVTSWEVVLPEVEVGGIKVHNVRAAVLAGAFPREILLGMTFLQYVEMRESAGVLVLESKL